VELHRLQDLFGRFIMRASYVMTPVNRLTVKQTRIGPCELIVTANDDVGRAIYYRGNYEPTETQYLRQVIREHDICVDVGANIGYYSTLMASLAHQGQIHAFEPDPTSYAMLQLNVRLNRLSNVVLNQKALGEQSGEVPFVLASDRAFSGLMDTGRKPVERITNVTLTTLDQYLRETGLERIDFLKADVEGAEGAVVRGARGIFESPDKRPRLVMLELYEPNQYRFGDNIDRIVSFMREMKYEPFVVIQDHCLAFTRELHNKFYNVFFSQHGEMA